LPTADNIVQFPAAPPRLAYRVSEVAAMLGVSRSTVERAIADGRLKSTKTLGTRLVRADSVAALLAA
jgi:excisionase family DNA binding protein